jgi:hypothetical protein
MAEAGCVYDASPVPRAPADILVATDRRPRQPMPKARGKWLVASVLEDAARVVGKVFDEAERRDPEHLRSWIALVDGNNHQIERIGAEAARRQVSVPILIDFIHVLEYLWKAAWSFYAREGTRRSPW